MGRFATVNNRVQNTGCKKQGQDLKKNGLLDFFVIKKRRGSLHCNKQKQYGPRPEKIGLIQPYIFADPKKYEVHLINYKLGEYLLIIPNEEFVISIKIIIKFRQNCNANCNKLFFQHFEKTDWNKILQIILIRKSDVYAFLLTQSDLQALMCSHEGQVAAKLTIPEIRCHFCTVIKKT